jgi:hypothetical protein
VAFIFYLRHASFVAQLAPTSYDALSTDDKDMILQEQRHFEETYGPMGLRAAHMDAILILKEVFCKFPPLAHLVHLRQISEVNRNRLGGTAVWDSILRAMAPSDAFVCRFTLNTVQNAGEFDGKNWHELTSTLTADILKATQQKISLRDLAAMRLLDTIRVVGQHHADWQALHRTLIDLTLSLIHIYIYMYMCFYIHIYMIQRARDKETET